MIVLGRQKRSLRWFFLHRDLFSGLSVVFHWCIPYPSNDYRFQIVLNKGKMSSSVYFCFIRRVLAILASLIINKYFNQFVTLHKQHLFGIFIGIVSTYVSTSLQYWICFSIFREVFRPPLLTYNAEFLLSHWGLTYLSSCLFYSVLCF